MNDLVHVLTNDDRFAELMKDQLTGLGYRSKISKNLLQFQENVLERLNFFLVLDEVHFESDIHTFLLNRSVHGLQPAGLIVISELNGFQTFLDQVAASYVKIGVPFMFLETPFNANELGELFDRFNHGLNPPPHLKCFKSFYSSSSTHGKFGSILRLARENIGVDQATVAKVAQQLGLNISEGRLAEIELDEDGSEIEAYEWRELTQLLYESTQSYFLGFEPYAHLRRVKQAILEGTYPFSMNFILRRKLVNLDRRDEIEKTYLATVANQASR